MTDLEFQVRMVPVPKGRPRLGAGGKVYTPAKTRAAEHAIRMAVRRGFNSKPFDCPLSIRAIFYLPKPKKTNRLKPIVKPDVDNLLKLLLDALNGLLWVDDSIICHIEASKVYVSGGGQPGIVLTVTPLMELS